MGRAQTTCVSLIHSKSECVLKEAQLWQLYGHVHVTAETKEAAIEYALGPECPLPPGDYVTDSVAVDEDIEVEEE